jgi:hypothetical protein
MSRMRCAALRCTGWRDQMVRKDDAGVQEREDDQAKGSTRVEKPVV